jgi:NAD(P)-dependent dehydrogenase (short-subunit alcohol dehydrogenase family)
MSLKDEVVIIKGGGTGMGTDGARSFHEAGA